MCDNDPTTGYWSAEGGECWVWSEFKITGKGSLKKGSLGLGIEVEFTPKATWSDWWPPGSESFAWWGSMIAAVTNPEGEIGYWWMESWDGGMFESGNGNVRSTWGHSIPFKWNPDIYAGHNSRPECYQGYVAPYELIRQGVHIVENGTMLLCWQGSGRKDFITVHLQTGASCAGGISYDIINDEWSTIENSCYV
jgi:hypothetical protein